MATESSDSSKASGLSKLRERILDSNLQGNLLAEMGDRIWRHEGTDCKEAANLLATLHNKGEIDLPAIAEPSALNELSTHKFFSVQSLFVDAIPTLHTSIEPMMSCVCALVDRGGEDLAAWRPNGAFRDWCRSNPKMPDQLTKLALERHPNAVRLLTFGIEASGRVELGLELITCDDQDICRSALTALSRIECAEEMRSNVLEAFEASFRRDDADDDLNATALGAALEFAVKWNLADDKRVAKIVREATARSGAGVWHVSARAIAYHGKLVGDAALTCLFAALLSVDPSHKGTLQHLDSGLRRLLSEGKEREAVDQVLQLSLRSGGDISPEAFESFGHALAEAPDRVRGYAIVSWLLDGNAATRNGLNSMLQSHRSPINLPLSEFDLDDQTLAFLCRKAIGYFFANPVLAGTVVVSVLRFAGERLGELSELLFDPLLRNYGGELREYLDSISDVDAAKPYVDRALNLADEHLAKLDAVGAVPELHPSENDRQVERLKFSDLMRTAQKDAQKQSTLLNLVSKSTVLYGNKTLAYVYGPEDEKRPVTMNLTAHSTSIELPRLEVVDPVGLDLMLRFYRTEGRPS